MGFFIWDLIDIYSIRVPAPEIPASVEKRGTNLYKYGVKLILILKNVGIIR